MVLPSPQSEAVRDVIERALSEVPGLLDPAAGGNMLSMQMVGASQRIATRLSEAGFLPSAEPMEEGQAFEAVLAAVRSLPKSVLADVKRSSKSREDFLSSPRVRVAQIILRELEIRGFRITKAFVGCMPHGGGWGGFKAK